MRKTAALCLLAITAVAGNLFAGAEARMAGKITDAVTKAGVPNVTIDIASTGGRNFKTQVKGDKNGDYRLLVIDGTLPYKMTFSAPGYVPYEENVKLKLGEMTPKDIELTPASAAAATAGMPTAGKPDPAVLAFNEGAGLFNERKLTEAAAKFEEAVAAKPDLIAGWEALSKVYLAQKDYAKSIDRANKALALAPDETEMYTVLYDDYTATGDKAKAAEAKAKMPADAAVLFNDAAKLINSGKDKDAEPLLKQAISVNDKFAPAYYELGMLYVRAQKNADAKANLQKYLELEPNGKDAGTAKEMLKYVQ